MHGEGAAGGNADVHWLGAADAAGMEAAAAQLFATNVCDHAQVLLTGSAGHYSAESYTIAGTRIRFCGHGALAAAWVACTELEPAAASLDFHNADRFWQARRTGTDRITLVYSRPRPQDCAVPDFAAAALGRQPLAAATVGGPAGYLILTLPDAAAVQTLQPDVAAIVAATQCAVIATAPVGDGFVFRYFAPQYDTPEDPATGSAAVQLAAFWQPRLQVEKMQVRQLSHHGAAMEVACRGDTVELTARVGYRGDDGPRRTQSGPQSG